jgi:hypothetical protein
MARHWKNDSRSTRFPTQSTHPRRGEDASPACERRSDNAAEERGGGIPSGIVPANPGKLRVFCGAEPRFFCRFYRAQEIDFYRPRVSSARSRIVEGPGVEGALHPHSETGLLSNLSAEGFHQVLAFFDVPAGNVPGSGKRGHGGGPSQQEEAMATEQRGRYADVCPQVWSHGRQYGSHRVSRSAPSASASESYGLSSQSVAAVG